MLDSTPHCGANEEEGLSERDFARLAQLIQERLGIQMPPTKKVMLESRLRRRLRQLGLTSYQAYCDRLFGAPEASGEFLQLVDLVTTNKTEFFREPRHFEVLVQQVLCDELLIRLARERRPLRVWSAGCSSGEEPYSLAMVLAEEAASRRFSYEIMASDISMRVLREALRAIYPEQRAGDIPAALRSTYLLRSKNHGARLVRVVPELRRQVRFRRVNLLESPYPVDGLKDVIFCRNVLIYFDRPTQLAILERFCSLLEPGGHLFLGHSETITGFSLPLESIAPTVYRRP